MTDENIKTILAALERMVSAQLEVITAMRENVRMIAKVTEVLDKRVKALEAKVKQ